jgi:uncharacterized membrane protein
MFEQIAELQKKRKMDYTSFVIVAVFVPVYLLFAHLGKEQMGKSAVLVLTAVMLAIRIRWDLRRRLWFWAMILSLLALHLPLLFFLPWPAGWLPIQLTLPVALADFLIVLGAARLIGKRIAQSPPS